MNWEMISAVGQMLGAVGVIISIIYLAAQIRNQNKESRRAAMNVLTTHWSDLNRTLVENPDFATLWLRALQSFDQLDGASKLRFGAHLGRFLRFADRLYLAVLDGTLDRRLWRGYERTLADTVAYPGFQTWWATRKHWHTDEFCALIDRHIQTCETENLRRLQLNSGARRSASLSFRAKSRNLWIFLRVVCYDPNTGCDSKLHRRSIC
jgi:hypothetical protein